MDGSIAFLLLFYTVPTLWLWCRYWVPIQSHHGSPLPGLWRDAEFGCPAPWALDASAYNQSTLSGAHHGVATFILLAYGRPLLGAQLLSPLLQTVQ